MGFKGPKMILFWCLMPKGEKLRPKQNGSSNHLWILKIEELDNLFFYQTLLLQNYGGEFWLWEKGEFLALLINFTLGISLDLPKQVCFDLEIGKRIWFAKTNQVVVKNDPNMPNPK
jgi:hypothetical protein